MPAGPREAGAVKPCTPIPAPYAQWDLHPHDERPQRDGALSRQPGPVSRRRFSPCDVPTTGPPRVPRPPGATTGAQSRWHAPGGDDPRGLTHRAGAQEQRPRGHDHGTATIPGHFKMRSRFCGFYGHVRGALPHPHPRRTGAMYSFVRVCPTKDKDSCSESDNRVCASLKNRRERREGGPQPCGPAREWLRYHALPRRSHHQQRNVKEWQR
jgi:hypothetical protein